MKTGIDRPPSADVSVVYYIGKILGFWIRWFFLICISFIILYPLVYMVSISLRSYIDFYDMTVVWVPKNYTLENFQKLFGAGLGKSMLHTFVITLFSTVCQLAVTSTVGYGFGRFRFKGNGFVFALVVFTIVIPPQMLGLSNYMLMNSFDFFGLIQAVMGKPTNWSLLDGPQSFIIPALLGQGIRAGLFILVFRQIYSALPKELEEAANIDGCGTMSTYLRIMAPNASNAFLISGIFSVVWYWTDYYMSATFLSTFRTMAMELVDLRILLRSLIPRSEQNVYRFITMEQAACLLLILPLLITFLLIQKFFTKSIDKTGLVG